MRRSIVILAAIAAALALAGCDGWRSQPQPTPPPTVAEQIRSIGSTVLWWGSIGAILGVVVRAVLFASGLAWLGGPVGGIVSVIARVPGIAGIGTLLAQAGAVAAACGAAAIWLADHIWLVVLSCVAAGLAWAWVHRAFLRRRVVAFAQACGVRP